MKIRKKQTQNNAPEYKGIIRQIQRPLALYGIGLLLLTVILTSLLLLRLSSYNAMERASDQAEDVAERLQDYRALPQLIDYWLDHADDLDPVYDEEELDEMEAQFRELHPTLLSISDLTEVGFEALSKEDKRQYARICMGRLSTQFDNIKRVFHPQWLFCFTVRGNTMYFLVTGTDVGESRLSQGGEIYELGVSFPLTENNYPRLMGLLKDPKRYTPETYFADIDMQRDSVASWAPVFIEDKPVAVVGSSMSYFAVFRAGYRTILYLAILMVIAFTCLELWTVLFMKRRVITPISEEESTIRTYMETKNTEKTVEKLKTITTNNEIESLAVSFSQMIEEIDLYVTSIREITAEKERIGAELDVAKQIQADLLPNVFPPYPERSDFEVYAFMKPAREVGGDFYDFFLKDEDHLVLVIGDVSGKGVPAAIFMAISQNTIRNTATAIESPREILAMSNTVLCHGNAEAMFVTIWIGIVDLKTGHVRSGNAGHEDPVIRRRDGMYELDIYQHDIPLGIMDDIKDFDEREFDLHPGDSLFVYTDGVPEAADKNEEFYGTERMLKCLNEAPNVDAERIVKRVGAGVAHFAEGAVQFDDITMLSFRYFGDTGKDT